MAKRQRKERYYVMDCEHDDAMLLQGIDPPGDDEDWFAGRRFATPPDEPVEVPIEEGYEDQELLEFFPSEMLMREDLVECLRTAGVDNMDVYDAVIVDDENGTRHEGYKAVNVIGVLSAADPARTVFAAGSRSRKIDADIDSLAIDAAKTGGALMFRLHETVTGLIVHEKVKKAVEAAGTFPNMVFHDPENWVG